MINYFISPFLAILGLTSLTEVFMESDRADKIDDLFIFVIGLFATILYLGFKDRLHPLVLPFMLLLALVVKIIAIYLEFKDPAAVGDDFGIAQALFLAVLFIGWQLISQRRKK